MPDQDTASASLFSAVGGFALRPGLRTSVIAAALVLLMFTTARAQVPPGFEIYLMGFLVRTTGQSPASGTETLQKAHQTNLNAMRQERLLLASGAFTDRGELLGMLIFSGDQRETVEKRIAEDPLVKAGQLTIALGPWIGPAGIGDEYAKRAAANPGAPDKMRTYQVVLLKNVLATRMMPEEQRGLLLQMDTLAKSGKLVAAGPVLEGSDLAWVFMFSSDAEETDALAADNPAVKAGKMVAERHPWTIAEGVLPAGFKVPMR
jgi:uncharacterized protein YciI